jgi:hypothetical protein
MSIDCSVLLELIEESKLRIVRLQEKSHDLHVAILIKNSTNIGSRRLTNQEIDLLLTNEIIEANRLINEYNNCLEKEKLKSI